MAIERGEFNTDVAQDYARRNILMLSYYYPPLADVGCRRSVALSKYFKKYGWKPVVLSVSNPDRTFCIIGKDAPPDGVEIHYCRSLVNTYWTLGKMNGLICRFLRAFGLQLTRNHFYDLINIPDFFWGWIPSACFRGYQLIKEHSIDAVYVSCSPFSSAVAGVLLKKLTGKPLVIDFRDPFGLEVPPFPLYDAPKYRRNINRKIEAWLLRHADIFVVTPDEIRKRYIQQYPHVRDKIHTIYNGIEPDDIKVEERKEFAKFTIVYGGSFYFDHIRSDIFFQALARLKTSGKISARTFQFLYFGRDQQRIIDKAKENRIEDLVVASPIIPYQSMLNILAGADLQLLRIVEANMGTKIFDGIALNVPLLATISDGEASDIVRKYSPDSYLVGTESIEKVVDAILDAMGKRYLSKRKSLDLNARFLRVFSREVTTRQLMRIMEKNIFGQGSTACGGDLFYPERENSR